MILHSHPVSAGEGHFLFRRTTVCVIALAFQYLWSRSGCHFVRTPKHRRTASSCLAPFTCSYISTRPSLPNICITNSASRPPLRTFFLGPSLSAETRLLRAADEPCPIVVFSPGWEDRSPFEDPESSARACCAPIETASSARSTSRRERTAPTHVDHRTFRSKPRSSSPHACTAKGRACASTAGAREPQTASASLFP
ncbi:hypothetical protein BV25DRAFT_322909 [Artomyces pyxidatus]|uniref:Uncharacterized protein n=1 Tax=Artomyces pyxidatus TaxID=48021 RepID=A0ACB8SEU0_9AGAM|nr:hypothetical protein BV25DRAFT_322909 [Artomyces pyxidatus]